MNNMATVFIIITGLAVLGLIGFWIFDRPSHKHQHS